MNKHDLSDPKFLSITNPHWTELGLHPGMIKVMSEKGISKFTPVQAEAFDPVVNGRHVIGRSRTGTGKTLAFGLPSLTRVVSILKQKGIMDSSGKLRQGRKVRMIVLCPTRELARQVQEELAEVARPVGLSTEVFHGGVSYDPQAKALYRGLDVLVGTPGRIIDHLERGNLDLSECNIVILDEAGELAF
jgi:ATP-dependent RNA helicase DDX21